MLEVGGCSPGLAAPAAPDNWSASRVRGRLQRIAGFKTPTATSRHNLLSDRVSQVQLRQFAIPAEIKMAAHDRRPVQPRFMHHDNNQRCASVSFIKTGGAGELVDSGIGGLHRVLYMTSGRVAGFMA